MKAAVVRQAFTSGLVSPVAYVDGSAGFVRELSLDLAADIATEVFIERLAMLIEDDECLPDDEDETDSVVLRLFARIIGRQPASRADIEALDVEGTKAFLQEQLAALVAHARSSRRPIPAHRALAAQSRRSGLNRQPGRVSAGEEQSRGKITHCYHPAGLPGPIVLTGRKRYHVLEAGDTGNCGQRGPAMRGRELNACCQEV